MLGCYRDVVNLEHVLRTRPRSHWPFTCSLHRSVHSIRHDLALIVERVGVRITDSASAFLLAHLCQCNQWSNCITFGCVTIYFFICVCFSLKDLPCSSCLCWLDKLDSIIRLAAVALIQNGMYRTSMLLLLCRILKTSWTEECSLCSGCGSASLFGVGPCGWCFLAQVRPRYSKAQHTRRDCSIWLEEIHLLNNVFCKCYSNWWTFWTSQPFWKYFQYSIALRLGGHCQRGVWKIW